MTTLRTRVSGFPFVITGDRGAAWVSRFEYGPVMVTVHRDLAKHLTFAVSDAKQWIDAEAMGMVEHMVTHSADDALDCETCMFWLNRMRYRKENSNPQPLPQVHSPKQGVSHAIWYRGERVRSITDYWNAGEDSTTRFCRVETISVVGELTAHIARVEDITVSAYRTIV